MYTYVDYRTVVHEAEERRKHAALVREARAARREQRAERLSWRQRLGGRVTVTRPTRPVEVARSVAHG